MYPQGRHIAQWCASAVFTQLSRLPDQAGEALLVDHVTVWHFYVAHAFPSAFEQAVGVLQVRSTAEPEGGELLRVVKVAEELAIA